MYHGLGAISRADQWANLVASMEDVNAHPLAADAPADTVQTRQLVIASLARAENALQGADQATADAAYQLAQQQYAAFKAAQTPKETPSSFALWLANLGLDISNPLVKYAGLATGILVAVIAGPPVLAAVLRPRPARANPRRRGIRRGHHGHRRRRYA